MGLVIWRDVLTHDFSHQSNNPNQNKRQVTFLVMSIYSLLLVILQADRHVALL